MPREQRLCSPLSCRPPSPTVLSPNPSPSPGLSSSFRAHYRRWLARVLYLLLFSILCHLQGMRGNTRQEQRLSPGQINHLILPDTNWAETCPQEAKSSHSAPQDACFMAPPTGGPWGYPSALGAPVASPKEGKRGGLCLRFAEHRSQGHPELWDLGLPSNREIPGKHLPELHFQAKQKRPREVND